MVVIGWRDIGVAVEGPDDLVERVLGQLPPFFGPQPQAVLTAELSRADGLVTVGLQDDLSYRGPEVQETFRAAASRIELALVDRLPELTAVHAGVVATERGAILLPGRSMAGKSTLTRELLEQGATYLSDEFALIDSAGRVHPYPRAMTIRTSEGSVRHVPAKAMAHDDGALDGCLIAALTYGTAWETRDLSPGEATMTLIDNCVSVRRNPAGALQALTSLAERARAIAGTRGEAAAAAELLRG